MDTIKIVGGILIMLAVIASVPVTNIECNTKYSYKPFNLLNALMVIVSYVLFAAMMYYDTNAPKVFYNFSMYEIVFLVVGALIIGAIFIRITSATNIIIGAYATLIQLTGAIIIAPLLFLFHKSNHADTHTSVKI